MPIALPYGRYLIYTGAPSARPRPSAPTTTLTVVDGVVTLAPATGALMTGVLGNGNVNGSNVVTLDPRVKN